jgi:hypothetical protein
MADISTDQSQRKEWWYWILAFTGILIFTSLKSIRLPIEYPSTLYLLNYQEGFTKRALFGSIVFSGDGLINADARQHRGPCDLFSTPC